LEKFGIYDKSTTPTSSTPYITVNLPQNGSPAIVSTNGWDSTAAPEIGVNGNVIVLGGDVTPGHFSASPNPGPTPNPNPTSATPIPYQFNCPAGGSLLAINYGGQTYNVSNGVVQFNNSLKPGVATKIYLLYSSAATPASSPYITVTLPSSTSGTPSIDTTGWDSTAAPEITWVSTQNPSMPWSLTVYGDVNPSHFTPPPTSI
jgi:hypothetical protein